MIATNLEYIIIRRNAGHVFENPTEVKFTNANFLVDFIKANITIKVMMNVLDCLLNDSHAIGRIRPDKRMLNQLVAIQKN
ncbi:hypothetical protein MGH68_16615 [Erysipelothrix sp. D19-032]